MGLEEDIENLSARERRVLSALGELGTESSVEDVQEDTGLSQSAVMRAALELEENGFLEIQEKKHRIVSITEEGKSYLEDSLPERKVLETLEEEKYLPIDSIPEKSDLSEGKANISTGWLKKKGWAEIEEKEGTKVLKITDDGQKALEEKAKDELLLGEFEDTENTLWDQIPTDLADEIPNLRSRGLIRVKERVRRGFNLTEKGQDSLNLDLEYTEKVSELSSELLRTGRWREVNLKEYNVTAEVSPVYPGKEHPQRRMIERLRSILLRIGFKEIRGPIVESEFWNFDALFQAQNHPAREIHDTLSLSKPESAKILDENLLKRVKEAHENGVAGSDGWEYDFDEEVSRRPILRSQTTADSVRYLARQPDPPVKVFCIDKVFRRERIDYQHLAEFPQAEGIVMAPELNFRHLLGYLKQILVEMGISKIRFRPGYFPYTEPSVEADGYFPELDEWIELLGAGMFRPELLEPLNIEYPVLAWGIGFSRLAMIRMGIEDMRDLHKNDIDWLNKQPLR
ncbi:hypothetical protein AKJ54_00610 [candidate division MSBL1 archaeon SCGC-AAA382K21]|uniref:Phenylalanine--tRNA ligase alpha subunit n=1 Tax=candidate division MSBL1 archaeon SCGC-AAA382K21 TaxID=1698283 RepID=A0A133VL73_9EURY|nr:hypothetical protein AKJ54_00610 [candidate division MSBL1 archaeon SCGC-AAA382K21]